MHTTHETSATQSRSLARILAAVGALIVVSTSLLGGASIYVLLFAVWALLPYAVLAVAGSWLRYPWAVAGAGLAALAVEIGIRLSVFVFPRGSTAAIALVFSPAFIGMVAMPAGALAGFVVGLAMRTGRLWLQAPVLTAGVAALALTTLGLGRPDLLPTAVYARQQALSQIGDPRVLQGADRFEDVTVSDASNWRLTGEFDGEPGEEVAIIDYQSVRVLTPGTLAPVAQLTLGGETATRWNWFSRLARSDGRLVIADTGGGFQETLVRALDGAVLWRYHPDPDLPPTSLVPADLNGDGNAEFYATTTHTLVRLDGSGHEIWRAPASLASIAFTTPRTHRDLAWIVTMTGQPQVDVWNDDGQPVAKGVRVDGPILGVLEWPDGRYLLVGGKTLHAVRLDGTVGFEWSVPEMSVIEAVPLAPTPGAQAQLAIVAAGPRDTSRWRMQIVSRDRAIVYDEVLGAQPHLLTARGADGTETLFRSGASLVAMRPRRTE